MAFSKPVVAADCGPIQRVIDETGCGRTFRSGDVADLHRVLRTLLLDPTKDAMGARGREAVEEKYVWDVDVKALMDTIHALGSKRPA
jgi:glycosyltransferase involved in cell wall biosynthesis